MRVRVARPEDLSALAAIAVRSYGHAFGAILDAATLRSRDGVYFAALFAEKRPGMLVAESDGEPVGFSLVTDGNLDMLFVDPAETGRGAGTVLLRAAEAAGARSLECFRDNSSARAFYESRGWIVVEAYERDFAGARHAFVLYRPARREAFG
jgi:putative acetyltransferase